MKDIIGELNKYPEGYWDFKGKIKTGIHNIGKYPATMVPDMQYELLNIIVKQKKLWTHIKTSSGTEVRLFQGVSPQLAQMILEKI